MSNGLQNKLNHMSSMLSPVQSMISFTSKSLDIHMYESVLAYYIMCLVEIFFGNKSCDIYIFG